MTQGTFYEIARARRALALQSLTSRARDIGRSDIRERPARLTRAAALRLMQRDLT